MIEGTMRPDHDQISKRRLVERAQIICAVDFLMERGIDPDDIVLQLAHHYYVDIDILNDVLAHAPARLVPHHPAQHGWQKVA